MSVDGGSYKVALLEAARGELMQFGFIKLKTFEALDKLYSRSSRDDAVSKEPAPTEEEPAPVEKESFLEAPEAGNLARITEGETDAAFIAFGMNEDEQLRFWDEPEVVEDTVDASSSSRSSQDGAPPIQEAPPSAPEPPPPRRGKRKQVDEEAELERLSHKRMQLKKSARYHALVAEKKKGEAIVAKSKSKLDQEALAQVTLREATLRARHPAFTPPRNLEEDIREIEVAVLRDEISELAKSDWEKLVSAGLIFSQSPNERPPTATAVVERAREAWGRKSSSGVAARLAALGFSRTSFRREGQGTNAYKLRSGEAWVLFA